MASGLFVSGCSSMDDSVMQLNASTDNQGMAKSEMMSGEACVGYGPQTPRDIDSVAGTNARSFSLAPPSTEMNLCNIHFHANAE